MTRSSHSLTSFHGKIVLPRRLLVLVNRPGGAEVLALVGAVNYKIEILPACWTNAPRSFFNYRLICRFVGKGEGLVKRV